MRSATPDSQGLSCKGFPVDRNSGSSSTGLCWLNICALSLSGSGTLPSQACLLPAGAGNWFSRLEGPGVFQSIQVTLGIVPEIGGLTLAALLTVDKYVKRAIIAGSKAALSMTKTIHFDFFLILLNGGTSFCGH